MYRRRGSIWASALVALTTALVFQLVRVLLPAMYGIADRKGTAVAGVAVLAVFALSVLAPVVRRVLGNRSALAASAGGLALARLALPLFGSALALVVAGAVLGLLALSLLLTSRLPISGGVTGIALLVGLGADAAIRSAFVTWDPVFRRGAVGLLVAGVLSAGLLVSVAAWLSAAETPAADHAPAVTRAAAGIAVGALLALEMLFLLSPGFVASSGGMSLPRSVVVVLGGVALAVAGFYVAWRRQDVGVQVGLVVGLLLAFCGFLLPAISGRTVVLVVLAAQLAAGATLAAAFGSGAGAGRASQVGTGLGWLVFGLTVLLYQLHFDEPLPFSNRWIVAGAGALAAALAFRRPAPALDTERRVPGRPAAVAAGSLVLGGVVVAVGLGLTTPGPPEPAPAGAALRVVEWNIRQAVTEGTGHLDPEEVASVLTRDGDPDIAVLPEAARGWPISGDIDLASWLSRRLGLPFLWAPAADNQFGTLVLSRLPVVSGEVEKLPVAGRAQGRSVLRAVLDRGGGVHMTLLATHLQHRNDEASMAARMAEIDLVLGRFDAAEPTILVGDFNPRQGDPPGYPVRRPGEFAEVRAILAAGFRTASDLTACSAPTAGRNCSDFVFVSPGLQVDTSVAADAGAFDHRPVVSTIRPG